MYCGGHGTWRTARGESLERKKKSPKCRFSGSARNSAEREQQAWVVVQCWLRSSADQDIPRAPLGWCAFGWCTALPRRIWPIWDGIQRYDSISGFIRRLRETPALFRTRLRAVSESNDASNVRTFWQKWFFNVSRDTALPPQRCLR